MNEIDHFVKRELKCKGYVRFVDDLLLFASDKESLWSWHAALKAKMAELRLTIHSGAHPRPVTEGIPFLGFVVYPTHRLVKRRKVVHFRRRLKPIYQAYQKGDVSRRELDGTVRGWLNHVRYADSWGLRRAMLADILL